MSIPRIERFEELSRVISQNSVVILLYVDLEDDRATGYATRLAKELSERLENIARVYIASRRLHPKPGRNIIVSMYVDGAMVFEQYDVFGVISLDMMAIRRGIKPILRKRGYKTLF